MRTIDKPQHYLFKSNRVKFAFGAGCVQSSGSSCFRNFKHQDEEDGQKLKLGCKCQVCKVVNDFILHARYFGQTSARRIWRDWCILPKCVKVSETEKTARTQLALHMSLGKILSCPLSCTEPFYQLTDSLDPLNTAVSDKT